MEDQSERKYVWLSMFYCLNQLYFFPNEACFFSCKITFDKSDSRSLNRYGENLNETSELSDERMFKSTKHLRVHHRRKGMFRDLQKIALEQHK